MTWRKHAVGTGIFLVVVVLGLWQSALRPLWTDEVFSQANVESVGLKKILLGRFGEGANSPVFYLVQMALTKAVGYRMPERARRTMLLADSRSMILLRAPAVLFVAATATVLFYYFAAHFGMIWGVLSALALLFSPELWVHMAEARPYALWCLLAVIQVLVALSLYSRGRARPGHFLLVNVLLAFVMPISILQIVFLGGVLWVFGRQRSLLMASAVIVPVAIAFYYRSVAMPMHFSFIPDAALILNNVPLDRILFLVFAFGLLFLQSSLDKNRLGMGGDMRVPVAGLSVSLAMTALLLSYVFVAPQKGVPFGITSRYFFFLVPFSVVIYIFVARELWQKAIKDGWARFNVVMLFILTGAIAFLNMAHVVFRLLQRGYL
jgi:hypothetical protein